MRVHGKLSGQAGPRHVVWTERGSDSLITTQANTVNTFTTTVMRNDGSGYLEVRRIVAPDEPSVLLAHIDFPAEPSMLPPGDPGLPTRQARAVLAPEFRVHQSPAFDAATNDGLW